MGRKRTSGLLKRGETWHIDKYVYGQRLRESTGSGELQEAERYLAKRIEETRLAIVYGVRPKRTFKEAATKFLLENQHKKSIANDASRLKMVVAFIGDVTIDKIHMGTLQRFIDVRRQEVSCRTINHGLKVVRHILNLAASEWIDDNGLTWLLSAPKIKLIPEPDLRKPNPLSWTEQARLFKVLPEHLKVMAMFIVNTGCRDSEVCGLRWDREVSIPELDTSVFIISTKNLDERMVVLNDTASSIIEAQRGKHVEYVFTYKGKPITRMLNSAWRNARTKANLDVRVHDLRHTYGSRLRAAGVSFEDRQDLLGHKSTRMTTHYSAAELTNLIEAANKVNHTDTQKPTLTVLKFSRGRRTPQNPHKVSLGVV